MTALAWLNDLVQWFGRWIPRLVLIEPTHRGVKFGPRGSARQVGPGLVVYWPITHALVQLPVTTQSLQLCAQVLPIAKDDALLPRVVVCAAALQFRVVRPVEAATKALHLHALVDNRGQAAIARRLTGGTDPQSCAPSVLEELRAELEAFGVCLDRLDFVQYGTGVALKNISDWSYADNVTGARPQ